MTPPQAAESRPARPGRWLAIETAGLYGGIAVGIVDESGVHDFVLTPLKRADGSPGAGARSAQTLAPAIQKTLEQAGWAPGMLSTIAVVVGPGSFTGLRVGVVTAKTLAYATGAAVISVDTLDVMAESVMPHGHALENLWPVFDAQRGEVFTARFSRRHDESDQDWRRETPTQRLTAAELAARVGPCDLVRGPMAQGPKGVKAFAYAQPITSEVLRAARRAWLNGTTDSVFALAPRYHRLSAAEEKIQAT